MEAIIIIKKNTSLNRVLEVPVESFLCRDLATFHCALYNESSTKDESYHLAEIPHNDSEGVDCYTSTDDELYLSDDNNNDIELEVHYEMEHFEETLHESGIYNDRKELVLQYVTMSKTDIDSLDISDELKRDIHNQAENIVSNKNDELDK